MVGIKGEWNLRIVAGKQTISDVTLFAEQVWHDDATRPALRLSLNGGLNANQMNALLNNPWDVYDGDIHVGTHTGYNVMARHEVTVVKVQSTEAAREEGVQEAMDIARGVFENILPAIVGSPVAINAATRFIPQWNPQPHAVDDVCMFEGIPYRCVQPIDSTANPDWTPATTPAHWMQYHGTTPDTARPWIAPTGAHDMYRVDEYMVWTDGNTYKCIADSVYSPVDYAQGWELVE